MSLFASIAPAPAELVDARAGDDLVPAADVVMDRAFTVAAPPDQVWPWLAQLGKGRAGWYLPRRLERLLPPARRAARTLLADHTSLAVGDVIPDYGGRDETFTVAAVDPPHHLVHRSRRRHTDVSWSIVLREVDGGTRVLLRLRLAPVRHVRLAGAAGGFFDAATIAGMAAGLRERLAESARPD